MSRAATKSELLTAAETQWTKMWSMIDSMAEVQRNALFSFDISADKEAHWGVTKICAMY